MKIKVDKEGASALEQLCDIALRQSGLHNLAAINKIITSTELMVDEDGVTDTVQESTVNDLGE